MTDGLGNSTPFSGGDIETAAAVCVNYLITLSHIRGEINAYEDELSKSSSSHDFLQLHMLWRRYHDYLVGKGIRGSTFDVQSHNTILLHCTRAFYLVHIASTQVAYALAG